MIIYGAGLAGCLAGALCRNAIILERNAEENHFGAHKAVLRFREDAIAHALGIPFKKVLVRKSIFFLEKEYSLATPRLSNMYSKKVSGKIAERSIGNLAPAERFIAPSDLHQLLGDMCRGRIHFNTPFTKGEQRRPAISTMPLPVLLRAIGAPVDDNAFQYAPIYVARWRVPDCDVHQTIYLPGWESPAYRATLTGEDLIIEGMRPMETPQELAYICRGLGLPQDNLQLVQKGEQRYGKIVPLPEAMRKELLYNITVQYGIFSLGRFACWRNILLDDVYHDLRKIEKLMTMKHYDLTRSLT